MRSFNWQTMPGWAKTLSAVVTFLVVWQFAVPLAHVPDYVLPLPSVIARRFAETFPSQLYHLGITASTTIAGLAIALVVGVLLARWWSTSSLKAVILPFSAAFNGIPNRRRAALRHLVRARRRVKICWRSCLRSFRYSSIR